MSYSFESTTQFSNGVFTQCLHIIWCMRLPHPWFYSSSNMFRKSNEIKSKPPLHISNCTIIMKVKKLIWRWSEIWRWLARTGGGGGRAGLENFAVSFLSRCLGWEGLPVRLCLPRDSISAQWRSHITWPWSIPRTVAATTVLEGPFDRPSYRGQKLPFTMATKATHGVGNPRGGLRGTKGANRNEWQHPPPQPWNKDRTRGKVLEIRPSAQVEHKYTLAALRKPSQLPEIPES